MNSRCAGWDTKNGGGEGEVAAFRETDEFYRLKHLYKAETTDTRGEALFTGRKGTGGRREVLDMLTGLNLLLPRWVIMPHSSSALFVGFARSVM
jgi:hypothetical protein